MVNRKKNIFSPGHVLSWLQSHLMHQGWGFGPWPGQVQESSSEGLNSGTSLPVSPSLPISLKISKSYLYEFCETENPKYPSQVLSLSTQGRTRREAHALLPTPRRDGGAPAALKPL